MTNSIDSRKHGIGIGIGIGMGYTNTDAKIVMFLYLCLFGAILREAVFVDQLQLRLGDP